MDVALSVEVGECRVILTRLGDAPIHRRIDAKFAQISKLQPYDVIHTTSINFIENHSINGRTEVTNIAVSFEFDQQ